MTLGGTLNIGLVNGFVPAPGNAFKVLSGSVTGKFTTLTPGYEPAYNATDVTLVFDKTPPVLAITGTGQQCAYRHAVSNRRHGRRYRQ